MVTIKCPGWNRTQQSFGQKRYLLNISMVAFCWPGIEQFPWRGASQRPAELCQFESHTGPLASELPRPWAICMWHYVCSVSSAGNKFFIGIITMFTAAFCRGLASSCSLPFLAFLQSPRYFESFCHSAQALLAYLHTGYRLAPSEPSVQINSLSYMISSQHKQFPGFYSLLLK